MTGAGPADPPARRPDAGDWSTCAAAGCPTSSSSAPPPRYWRNLGGGPLRAAPRDAGGAAAASLGDPGVQFIDADGDGRADLLVKSATQAGYFPMTFAGGWSRRSFQPYRQAPTVGLADPRVKLVDLDGDGLTDVAALRFRRLECWFNDADPRRAWQRTAVDATDPPPDIDLADPRVRLADMTGDGLQDIVLLRNGNIAYWPNLGHGRWGAPVQMRRAPRLPDGYDPRRVLLGDVDGDGVADLVYVDHGRVLLWGNQSGNAWTAAAGHHHRHARRGRHRRGAARRPARHRDGRAAVQPRRRRVRSPATLRFLDLTGGIKPYLLNAMDNHLGARTTVEYVPSTADSPARRGRPRPPGGAPRCRSRCTSSPGSRCTTRSPAAG